MAKSKTPQELLQYHLEKAKQHQTIIKRKEARQKLKSKRQQRKERETRIFQLGGMVEKMGLDQADYKFLLGLFWFGNELLSGKNADDMQGLDTQFLRLQGEGYLLDGIKMERPTQHE